VIATLIDQHTRNLLEVLPVHDLAAADAWDISTLILQTLPFVLVPKRLLPVHGRFPGRAAKFTAVEPEATALGTEVVFLPVLRVDFERFSAPWTCGWQEFTSVGQVGRTQWTDPVNGVDLLAARSTRFGFTHGYPLRYQQVVENKGSY
jgi:hypothetical protein